MLIKVDDMTEQAAKDLLKDIIKQLDALDCEDYFGSEGWKHSFGYGD